MATERPGSPRLCAGTLACRACAPRSGGNLRRSATPGGQQGPGAREEEETATDHEALGVKAGAGKGAPNCGDWRVGADTEDLDGLRADDHTGHVGHRERVNAGSGEPDRPARCTVVVQLLGLRLDP